MPLNSHQAAEVKRQSEALRVQKERDRQATVYDAHFCTHLPTVFSFLLTLHTFCSQAMTERTNEKKQRVLRSMKGAKEGRKTIVKVNHSGSHRAYGPKRTAALPFCRAPLCRARAPIRVQSALSSLTFTCCRFEGEPRDRGANARGVNTCKALGIVLTRVLMSTLVLMFTSAPHQGAKELRDVKQKLYVRSRATAMKV